MKTPDHPADPDEQAVLAERLRSAADSLTAEFGQLSRAEAERLIFAAAEEFRSAASVVHFVPTFAVRRARHLLRNGAGESEVPAPPSTTEPAAPTTESGPVSVAVTADDPQVIAPTAEPSSLPPGPSGPGSPSGSGFASAFYAEEAKRLLEKARMLRASALRVPGADQ